MYKLLHTVLGPYFVFSDCLAVIIFITINGMHQRRAGGAVCDISRGKSASDGNPASFWL